jgi:hypothetical protein
MIIYSTVYIWMEIMEILINTILIKQVETILIFFTKLKKVVIVIVC